MMVFRENLAALGGFILSYFAQHRIKIMACMVSKKKNYLHVLSQNNLPVLYIPLSISSNLIKSNRLESTLYESDLVESNGI